MSHFKTEKEIIELLANAVTGTGMPLATRIAGDINNIDVMIEANIIATVMRLQLTYVLYKDVRQAVSASISAYGIRRALEHGVIIGVLEKGTFTNNHGGKSYAHEGYRIKS